MRKVPFIVAHDPSFLYALKRARALAFVRGAAALALEGHGRAENIVDRGNHGLGPTDSA